MPNIFMMKGLPASGKSTVSKGMVDKDDGMKRVCKDDLRLMIQNGKYTPETEMFVLNVRDSIVRLAIGQGFDVVIDDTNLNPKHEESLRNLSDSIGAVFNVIEMETTLDECIRRDSLRPNLVGESVIRDMYDKYVRT